MYIYIYISDLSKHDRIYLILYKVSILLRSHPETKGQVAVSAWGSSPATWSTTGIPPESAG